MTCTVLSLALRRGVRQPQAKCVWWWTHTRDGPGCDGDVLLMLVCDSAKQRERERERERERDGDGDNGGSGWGERDLKRGIHSSNLARQRPGSYAICAKERQSENHTRMPASSQRQPQKGPRNNKNGRCGRTLSTGQGCVSLLSSRDVPLLLLVGVRDGIVVSSEILSSFLLLLLLWGAKEKMENGLFRSRARLSSPLLLPPQDVSFLRTDFLSPGELCWKIMFARR